MKKEHVRLSTSNGDIHAMTCSPQVRSVSQTRVVIFSHGFTVPGFESRRMFVDAADRLVEKGWTATLFDYRGNGYSDLDFSEMTIQTEVEDLNVVLDYVRSLVGPDAWLALWGVSLGTAIAAEVAAQREDQLDGLVEWCLSANLHARFAPRYAEDFAARGYTILPAGYTVRPSFVESMLRIDTHATLRGLALPRLFVHGDQDDLTPIELAEQAVREAMGDTTFHRVRGGVHSFKAQPPQYEEAISRTFEWLEARSRTAHGSAYEPARSPG